MIESHPLLSAPIEVPQELATRAKEREWPDGLLQRVLNMRLATPNVEWLLTVPSAAEAEKWVDTRRRLFDGPIRAREATWEDHDRLADLYANASEDVGDWQLTVERGPNPYAQFRLQEHANLQLLECNGVALAAVAHATRNSLIGGERYTVHTMSAWRVREGFRGYGLSRLLQHTAGPGLSWLGMVTVWYERSGNASQGWLDKVRDEMQARNHHVGELTASVQLLEPQEESDLPRALTVRATRPEDVPRCVELINRTHARLDLFRPYTPDFLEGRLDDPFWGPRPEWWDHVYSWDDHVVVEERSEVVACGGLWDRGEDVREVWRHKETGDERLLAPTALLDWGYAEGREYAMTGLIRSFLARTRALGRTHLLAPLEFTPELLAELIDLQPITETRALRSMGFHEGDVHVEPHIERPYTDLAYW